ncbi:MAG: XRE family transcriptional regulator [Allosphingosinicella sp.]
MDSHVTAAGKSVLEELYLDPADVVKGKLALRIHKTIMELGLTQRDAAERVPITQPKLSLLMRGKLADIGQAKLELSPRRRLAHPPEAVAG